MAKRAIMVGTGGFGNQWCRKFMPPNVRDGLVEVVAAVDLNPVALNNAREGLGLRDDQCYTDIHKAFAEKEADFVTIVVPPAFHESVVDIALAHDMDILSEKPIADSLEAAIRIVNKVKLAGRKMAVTMSHRFDQDKSTLRHLLRSGEYGDLDYLVCRFTMNKRRYGSWGKFRYEIDDPLMIEGAVHHLDIIADLAGAKCETIYAQTWNPHWGEFKGDSQGLINMSFLNGVKGFYEGAKTNAMTLYGWTNEYFRAECEKATLVLDHRKISCYPYKAEEQPPVAPEPVQLLQQGKWLNAWLIEKFVNWLNGGEPMETNVEDNLQSVALIFGAIKSSRTGQPVKVQDLLAETRAAVLGNGSAGSNAS
jgi:predicted dehydrogenase